MKKVVQALFISLLAIVLFNRCAKESSGLISYEQEADLGRRVDSIILNTPAEFPILDTPQYSYAYAYLDTVIDNILISKYIIRKKTFTYKIRIIDNNLLYAFATPGGNLYFYTGLIKYLNNGAQFAGVLSHLIAHIDRRHITENLESKYHIDPLLSVIWNNNPELLTEITTYLTGFSEEKFNSSQEYEADEYAVRYTSTTDYDPLGIDYFYTRISEAEQNNNVPEFLRVHPDPVNRLEAIDNVWTELDSPEGGLFEKEYNSFKASLTKK